MTSFTSKRANRGMVVQFTKDHPLLIVPASPMPQLTRQFRQDCNCSLQNSVEFLHNDIVVARTLEHFILETEIYGNV